MPTKRLPKHFWSDCLLEAMTGIDINQLTTHHGRVLQINDCRRHDYARSRGQIILESQTASASASKAGTNHVCSTRDNLGTLRRTVGYTNEVYSLIHRHRLQLLSF